MLRKDVKKLEAELRRKIKDIESDLSYDNSRIKSLERQNDVLKKQLACLSAGGHRWRLDAEGEAEALYRCADCPASHTVDRTPSPPAPKRCFTTQLK
jgi:uncharacterized protein HemX